MLFPLLAPLLRSACFIFEIIRRAKFSKFDSVFNFGRLLSIQPSYKISGWTVCRFVVDMQDKSRLVAGFENLSFASNTSRDLTTIRFLWELFPEKWAFCYEHARNCIAVYVSTFPSSYSRGSNFQGYLDTLMAFPSTSKVYYLAHFIIVWPVRYRLDW